MASKNRHKKISFITLAGSILLLFFWVNTSRAQTAAEYIAQGRAHLSQHTMEGLMNAHSKFQAALVIEPNNPEANFFFSLTRLPALLDNSASYTDGFPIENAKELLDGLDVDAEGRDLFEWEAKFTEDGSGDVLLPSDSPTGDVVQDFLTSVIMSEIEGVLTDLTNLDATFTTVLTASETGEEQDIEIDYGDILLYRSLLNVAKMGLSFISAYDMDVDIDTLVNMNSELFDVDEDLLDVYPNLLTLLLDGDDLMADAGNALLSAIDAFDEASLFIQETETDNQEDDLVTPDEIAGGGDFKCKPIVEQIKGSLVNKEPADLSRIEETWELTDDHGNTILMRIEKDHAGNFLGGDFHGIDGCSFLACRGWVEDFSMVDSNIVITTACGGGCPCSAILEGRMNEDGTRIISGTYLSQDCLETVSGTFTGLRTEYEETPMRIDVSEFFDDPISIRDYLPGLTHDPYTREIMLAKSLMESFPDRTLSGIFPDGLPVEGFGLDLVTIRGGSASGGSSYGVASCLVWGLAPWDIESLTIYGPLGLQYEFDLEKDTMVFYKYGMMYNVSAPSYPPEGWYEFVLIDKQGRSVSAGRYFTPNPIDVVDIATGESPADKAYVNTLTPALNWSPVTDERIDTLYYRVNIMDWNGKVNVYSSDRVAGTTITVPAGILMPNEVYQWNVRVFDSANGTSANNFSSSDWKVFCTGGENDPLNIELAFVHSRVEPDDMHDMTLFAIDIDGPAPYDIGSLAVSGPGGFSHTFDPIDDYHSDIYLHHEDGILTDGTYTFTIVDDRDGNTLSVDRDFTFNRLPVPEELHTPSFESYVRTTTPTFSWSRAHDETVDPLSYRVMIYDYNHNIIYKSPRSPETSATVPPDCLKIHNPYFWRVQVFDGTSTIQNSAVTNMMPFYVVADNPPSIISGQIETGMSGYTGGDIFVCVFDQALQPLASPLFCVTLSDIGSYTLYDPPTNTDLYIYALWDKDGSDCYTAGDWAGIYAENPVVLDDGGIFTNADIALNNEIPSASVTGHVSCDDFEPGLGDISIFAFDGEDPSDAHLLDSTSIGSPSEAYTLSNLPVDVYAYLFARWDRDGSGTKTPPDCLGKYSENPLLIESGGLTGIDIALIPTLIDPFSVDIHWIYYNDNSGRTIDYDYFDADDINEDGDITFPPEALISVPDEESNAIFTWESVMGNQETYISGGVYQVAVPQAQDAVKAIPTADISIYSPIEEWDGIPLYIEDALLDNPSWIPEGADADMHYLKLAYSPDLSKLNILMKLEGEANPNVWYRLFLDKDLDGRTDEPGDYHIDFQNQAGIWEVVSQGWNSENGWDRYPVEENGMVVISGEFIQATVNTASFGLPGEVNIYGRTMQNDYPYSNYDTFSTNYLEANGLSVIGGHNITASSPTEWEFALGTTNFRNVSKDQHYYDVCVGIGGSRFARGNVEADIDAAWFTGTYQGVFYEDALIFTAHVYNQLGGDDHYAWDWDLETGEGLILTGLDPTSTTLDFKVTTTDDGRTFSGYYRINSNDESDWQLLVTHTLPPDTGVICGFPECSPSVHFETGIIPLEYLCDGDINHDDEITPIDALCAFQTYLEICPTRCGPCEGICCDVNMDDDCTPADALCIFRKYLGIPCCLDKENLNIGKAFALLNTGEQGTTRLIVLADIRDDTGAQVPFADVWVVDPQGNTIQLRRNNGHGLYEGSPAGSEILLGDYTFYAEYAIHEAAPVVKNVSSLEILEPPVLLNFQLPEEGQPWAVSWEQVPGAQGYLVMLRYDNNDDQPLFTNVADIFSSTLPTAHSVEIPAGLVHPHADYELEVIAANGTTLEGTTAISSLQEEFSTRPPFSVPYKTIAIDGNYNDWSDPNDLVYWDTDGPDCAGGQDIQKVYLAQDDTFLYVRYVLGGPLDQSFGYKFGDGRLHTYVSNTNGQKRLFWAWDHTEYDIDDLGYPLSSQEQPADFVSIDGNQFEIKFLKSDARIWQGRDIDAWSDQGHETVCTDMCRLPEILDLDF
ncbi:MAG: hypothetical protein ACMUIL_01280 [bacterium]